MSFPRKPLTKTQKFDRTIVELLWPTLSKVSTTKRYYAHVESTTLSSESKHVLQAVKMVVGRLWDAQRQAAT